jgi:hypothetical protein
MAPSSTQPSFDLRSILEKDKLNGTNYMDWICNLRIVLRVEKNEDVLDTPLPPELAEGGTTAVKNAYKKACDNNLMLAALCLLAWNPSCRCSLKQTMKRTI